MAPERNSHEVDLMDESRRIKDELLDVQAEVQAVAHAKQAELLKGVRSRLHYGAAQPAILDGLVDTRIEDKSLVISPEALSTVLPITANSARVTETSRKGIERIIRHDDGRLLAIVGPCSIHDADATIEYAERVKEWRDTYGDELEIVMRFYPEKPRTEKDWKGIIYDPLLDGSDDINLGVVLTRMLACRITDMGVPLATERLNANTPQFMNGQVAYDAIGARNAEDQKAREYLSGTSSIAGQKHPQNGDIRIALQAITSANAPHSFVGMDENGMMAQVVTKGNPTAHVILRGSTDGPNYESEHIAAAKDLVRQANEKYPDLNLPESFVVDASHGNSRKNAANQIEVVRDIAEQIALGETALCGVMIESNLVAGAQKLKMADGTPKPVSELRYGQSITDECVDLDESETMLALLAGAVRIRRAMKEQREPAAATR